MLAPEDLRRHVVISVDHYDLEYVLIGTDRPVSSAKGLHLLGRGCVLIQQRKALLKFTSKTLENRHTAKTLQFTPHFNF